MTKNGGRRTFLKGAGLAVSASVLPSAGADASLAPAAAPGLAATEMPRRMTFVTIRRGAEQSLGIKTRRGILDVKRAESTLRLNAPTTIEEVFARGGGPALERLVERAPLGKGGELFLAEDAIEYGPCVTRPEKIICVGLNYRKHAAETNSPVPTQPILFNKYNTSLGGHGSVIKVSQEAAQELDYEVELVIVMGKVARNVGEADALGYVFGYATGNDFTARDLQRRSSQWMLGKSLDGFAPIGPHLVTADQVGDPGALRIECRVNGQVRQSSSTADMVFDCRKVVAYISRYFTLKPGDIIFTGTPEGVIAGYPKDKQVWLKAGDRIACSVEKLGELQFTLA
jgi:2-keto-4-pentenoate hydratase/2-oxohepta-3-ene-1,7-dioic acid hydratase in catechol pathway